MSHICVLIFEMARQLANEQNETAKALHTKRMFILDQTINITNWVQNFDPSNVNLEDKRVPNGLRGLDNWARGALKDYPKPNRIGSQNNSIDRTNSQDSTRQLNSGDEKSQFKVTIRSLANKRRRQSNTTSSGFDPDKLDQSSQIANTSIQGAAGLLATPRGSRPLGPITFNKCNSQQMDRFLKSSVPSSRRQTSIVGLSHILDQHKQGDDGLYSGPLGSSRRL